KRAQLLFLILVNPRRAAPPIVEIGIALVHRDVTIGGRSSYCCDDLGWHYFLLALLGVTASTASITGVEAGSRLDSGNSGALTVSAVSSASPAAVEGHGPEASSR